MGKKKGKKEKAGTCEPCSRDEDPSLANLRLEGPSPDNDDRPETSPYTSDAVVLAIGADRARYTIPKSFLLKHPGIPSNQSTYYNTSSNYSTYFGTPSNHYTSSSTTIELPNADRDVAHTLVHYLYIGSYQTLKTRDASAADRNATEYKRGLKAYCAARWYKLSGLETLAKERIEHLSGAVPVLAALDSIKTAFSTAPTNDQWLPEHLDKELEEAFRVDDALFTTEEFAGLVGGVPAFDRAVVKSVARILRDSLHARLAREEDALREEFACKMPLALGCDGVAVDAEPDEYPAATVPDCADALSDEPSCEIPECETLTSEEPGQPAESCTPCEEPYEEVSKDAECGVPEETVEECLPCEPEDACCPYEEPCPDSIVPEEAQELEPPLEVSHNDDAKPEELAVEEPAVTEPVVVEELAAPECPPDEFIWGPPLSKKDKKKKKWMMSHRWYSEVEAPIEAPPVEAPIADMPDEQEVPLPQDYGLEVAAPIEEETEKQDCDAVQAVEEEAEKKDDSCPSSSEDSAPRRSSRGTMSSQLDGEGLCDDIGTHLLLGKGWKECSRCSALVRVVAAQRAREVDADGGFEIV